MKRLRGSAIPASLNRPSAFQRDCPGAWGPFPESSKDRRRSSKGSQHSHFVHASRQTVGTVPPSMTNSAPWIAAARSEAR